MDSDVDTVISEFVHDDGLDLPTEVKLSEYFTWKTVGLLIFAMFVILAYSWLNAISMTDLWMVLTSVDVPLLVFALAIGYCFPLVEALAWRQILQLVDVDITVNEGYHLFWTTFTFGLLVPSAGAVETATRVKLTADLTKASPGAILSTIVIHRFLGLLAFIPMLPFLIYGIFLFFGIDLAVGLYIILLVAVLALMWIAFMGLIARKPAIAVKVALIIVAPITWLPFVDGPGLKEKTRSLIREFAAELSFLLKKPLKFGQALFWTECSLLIRWTSTYLLLISVGILGPYLALASVDFLSGTIDLIPIAIPGMEGIKEIGISELLYRFGATKSQSFATAVLMSFLRFYLSIFLGLALFLNLKRMILKRNHSREQLHASSLQPS